MLPFWLPQQDFCGFLEATVLDCNSFVHTSWHQFFLLLNTIFRTRYVQLLIIEIWIFEFNLHMLKIISSISKILFFEVIHNSQNSTTFLEAHSFYWSTQTNFVPPSYFKITFWCHRFDQINNEKNSRNSALASKKSLVNKKMYFIIHYVK